MAPVGGFDLHAAVAVTADDRDGLERLARYLLRPAIAEQRLELRSDGTIEAAPISTWRRHRVAEMRRRTR